MIIVCDTSSISNLLQIGSIELLTEIFGEITITPAVRRELYVLPEQAKNIDALSWIKVQAPQDQRLVFELSDKLDLGESESIALAIETKAQYLIIDEFKGRQIADSYGVKIIGILGILILAKQKGILNTIQPTIEELIQIGFRLNNQLVQKVLKRLGET